jgi:hypothetical protein
MWNFLFFIFGKIKFSFHIPQMEVFPHTNYFFSCYDLNGEKPVVRTHLFDREMTADQFRGSHLRVPFRSIPGLKL